MIPKTQETHDRGVSPVVGVALLIAIAVILAAVIGAVVLGLGVGMADAPQAAIEFEEDNGDLIVSHTGGDALDGDEIVLRGDGALDEDAFDDMAAGESQTLDDTEINTDEEVSIVWQDPNSDDESVIGTYRP